MGDPSNELVIDYISSSNLGSLVYGKKNYGMGKRINSVQEDHGLQKEKKENVEHFPDRYLELAHGSNTIKKFIEKACEFMEQHKDHLWCENRRLCGTFLYLSLSNEYSHACARVKNNILERALNGCVDCCQKYHDVSVGLEARHQETLRSSDLRRVKTRIESVRNLAEELSNAKLLQKMLSPVLFEILSFPSVFLKDIDIGCTISALLDLESVDIVCEKGHNFGLYLLLVHKLPNVREKAFFELNRLPRPCVSDLVCVKQALDLFFTLLSWILGEEEGISPEEMAVGDQSMFYGHFVCKERIHFLFAISSILKLLSDECREELFELSKAELPAYCEVLISEFSYSDESLLCALDCFTNILSLGGSNLWQDIEERVEDVAINIFENEFFWNTMHADKGLLHSSLTDEEKESQRILLMWIKPFLESIEDERFEKIFTKVIEFIVFRIYDFHRKSSFTYLLCERLILEVVGGIYARGKGATAVVQSCTAWERVIKNAHDGKALDASYQNDPYSCCCAILKHDCEAAAKSVFCYPGDTNTFGIAVMFWQDFITSKILCELPLNVHIAIITGGSYIADVMSAKETVLNSSDIDLLCEFFAFYLNEVSTNNVLRRKCGVVQYASHLILYLISSDIHFFKPALKILESVLEVMSKESCFQLAEIWFSKDPMSNRNAYVVLERVLEYIVKWLKKTTSVEVTKRGAAFVQPLFEAIEKYELEDTKGMASVVSACIELKLKQVKEGNSSTNSAVEEEEFDCIIIEDDDADVMDTVRVAGDSTHEPHAGEMHPKTEVELKGKDHIVQQACAPSKRKSPSSTASSVSDESAPKGRSYLSKPNSRTVKVLDVPESTSKRKKLSSSISSGIPSTSKTATRTTSRTSDLIATGRTGHSSLVSSSYDARPSKPRQFMSEKIQNISRELKKSAVKDAPRTERRANANSRKRDSNVLADMANEAANLQTSANLKKSSVLPGLFSKDKPRPEARKLIPLGTPITKGNPQRVERRFQKNKESDRTQRMFPSLSVLEAEVLSLDYKNLSIEKYALKAVPDSFENYASYYSVFEPLLFAEIIEKLKNASEECEERPSIITFKKHQSINQFVDTSWAVPDDNDWQEFSTNDLVVIAPKRGGTSWCGMNTVSVYGLGKITKLDRKRQMFEIRCQFGKNRELQRALRSNASFFIFKVMNMITIQREFTALKGLEKYHLLAEILNAKPFELNVQEQRDDEVIAFLTKQCFNAPQRDAIYSCSRMRKGIALLQGPPGTGKTRTVVGILGVVLGHKGNTIGVPNSSNPVPQNLGSFKKKQILLCAPSNAAVDELVLRVLGGIATVHGKFKPNIVRIVGAISTLDKRLTQVTFDELVSAELRGARKTKASGEDRSDLRDKYRELQNDLQELKVKLEDKRESEKIALEKKKKHPLSEEEEAELLRTVHDIHELRKCRSTIEAKMCATKNSIQRCDKEIETQKKKAEKDVLLKADIVCCTLSGAGHETLMTYIHSFDYVIIDEAAQCVELELLIPFKYECEKVILIGDPNQLPATVFSSKAKSFNYDQSLFKRHASHLESQGHNSVSLLSIQYRMHPLISAFPSMLFYDSKLKDDEVSIRKGLYSKKYHRDVCFGPCVFLDVAEGVESRGSIHSKGSSKSLYNEVESSVISDVYRCLTSRYSDEDFRGKIGVITPYKRQKVIIREKLRNDYGEDIFSEVEVNTIDGFQGREKDVIILSTVRSNNRGLGFLGDLPRMNVALTRAKYSLIIVGSSRSLESNEAWRKLIEELRRRNAFFSCPERLLQSFGTRKETFAQWFSRRKDQGRYNGESEYTSDKGRSSSVVRAPRPNLTGKGNKCDRHL